MSGAGYLQAARNDSDMDALTEFQTTGIEVFYQPQIFLSDGRVFGAEALVRKRTGRGLLGAEKFVPQLEAVNRIGALDLLVLERVIAQQRTWCRQGLNIKISVNLSRNSFNEPEFMRTYLSMVARCGLPPERLGFELTESALGLSPDNIRTMLSELSDRGYAVALDDFGTGYSSLAMLDSLPIQYAKIDKAFLNPRDKDGRWAAFLQDMIRLLQNLGIKAICEGVETREQALLLRRIGCDLAQGFYFSKPLPANELEKKLMLATSCHMDQ